MTEGSIPIPVILNTWQVYYKRRRPSASSTPSLLKPKDRLSPLDGYLPAPAVRVPAQQRPQPAPPSPASATATLIRENENAPAWRTDPSLRFRHILASLTRKYGACASRAGGGARPSWKGHVPLPLSASFIEGASSIFVACSCYAY